MLQKPTLKDHVHEECALYWELQAPRDNAGVDIADDGTVEFRKEERVEFSHIVRSKHIGIGSKPLITHSLLTHYSQFTSALKPSLQVCSR